MSTKTKIVAQNPLVLRCHRLMEAFAKSDDERDFYLDRQEGFLIYVDLDKSQEELDELLKELKTNADRYCQIPKLTFYEIKKVMEGFVNEKVYDIDTKEKLLDIIQSKEARENFLEFIYDHHTELEKWQQYYQERFRVRIIEWLRNNSFEFVFEEDLELTKSMVERIKINLFTLKAGKDVIAQRKVLVAKAKTYYSSEALNPRPKRGRPPKQVAKVETEPQFSQDIYTTIPKAAKPFLFAPDYHGSSAIFTFSGKFASEEDLLAHRRQQLTGGVNFDLQNLQQKLAALRSLSSGWSTQKDGGMLGSVVPESIDLTKIQVQATEPEFDGYNSAKPAAKKAIEPKKAKSAPVAKAKTKGGPTKSTLTKSMPIKSVPTKSAVRKNVPVKKKPEPKKPVAKMASKAKPVAKAKPQLAKKPVAKARLRPLPKKDKKAPSKKEKPQAKKKSSPLRHLRRAKAKKK